MFHRLTTLAVLLASTSALHAGNLLTVTGTSPSGFYNQTSFVWGWSQAATYTNVTITMPLEDETTPNPIGGVEGTVYLMNQIGAGTTSANQVVAPFQISGLTASYTTVTLFSGLTLPAGNYYLVLVPTAVSPMTASPAEVSTGQVVTTGPSVAVIGDGATISLASYPPATTITLQTPDNLFLSITGNASIPNTPAPSSLILLLTGLAATGLWLARRKFASS